MPITGVPLPFISYGGSSLLPSLMAVGVLLAFARQEAQRGRTGTGRHTSDVGV
jgi:cell division protein FtsW